MTRTGCMALTVSRLTRWTLIGVCWVTLSVPVPLGAGAHEFLPGTFPLSSTTTLTIKNDVTLNGHTISKGKTGPHSVVNRQGTRQTVGQFLPPLSPPAFPLNASRTKVTGTDGLFFSATPTFYQRVTIAKSQSGAFLGEGPFHIGELKVEEGATLKLGGGTYFMKTLKLKKGSRLVLTGRPVTVHIGHKMKTKNRVEVNAQGRAPDFRVFLHQDATFTLGKDTDFSGVVYGPHNKKVVLKKDVSFQGALIANGPININKHTTFTYTPADQSAVSAIALDGRSEGNTPPVAEAGAAQTVQLSDTVQLNGSDSTDVDGDQLSYAWTFLTRPPDSTAALSDPTAILPTLRIDQPGDYTLQLVVNDGMKESEPDTVTISTLNSLPRADAGPDQTVLVTQSALLDGRHSSDVDHDPLTFYWSVLSKPRSSSAMLSDPTSPMPHMTVDQPGTYAVQLIVNDGIHNSAPDTIIIQTNNSTPVAQPGPDRRYPLGQTVTLDGTPSSDVDGDALTFRWSLLAKPPGSQAVLDDVTTANPTFTADQLGVYVGQLIVNDGKADSLPTTVTIHVTNTPPVAEAGPDQMIPVGNTITLDGSGSRDVDGDPLTFHWVITTRPIGSLATLSHPTSLTPNLVPDRPGIYVIELIVNDGTADSASDAILVIAENTPPLANAGTDQTVAKGARVQFEGNGSTDANGDPLTFQWSILDQPVSSTATLSDPAAPTASLIPDQEGVYVIQLIVHDGLVESAPDIVMMTAVNNPPTLAPIGPQIIPLGQTLTFSLTGTDPNNDPLRFSATSLPLPANMMLNSVTGDLTWRPTAEQVGSLSLTFLVNDGALMDSETVTFTVQGAPLGGVTGLRGRILDTTDVVTDGTETPVVGATVSLLGTSFSTTSDAQGFFNLTGLPEGSHVLAIDGSTSTPALDGSSYAGFRERTIVTANVTTLIDRPFFLPRLDPASQMLVNGMPVHTIDPQSMTVVANPTLGVFVDVPPHTAKHPDGTDYMGALSISEVPASLAPAALPDELQPGLLITIQPPGVIFDPPASITFTNIDQLLPGSEVHIWSLEPATGRFAVVGIGQVSSDGSRIQTIAGGVRATDWFAPIPPPAKPGGSGNQPPQPPKECQSETGSQTAMCSGNLTVKHQTVPYQSLGTNQTSRFVYRSLQANPQPIIARSPQFPGPSTPAPLFSTQLQVAGLEQGIERFTDTSGMTTLAPFRQALQFDASALPTGAYPYWLTLTSHWPETSIARVVLDTLIVRNEYRSPFGAGWTLEGLNRLHRQQDGSALLTQGHGGVLRFTRPQPGTFEAPESVPLEGRGGLPPKVAMADFNQDAVLDLAIPTPLGLNGELAIHLGDGSGTFGDALTPLPSLGGVASDIAVADFNQDGRLDLVTTGSLAVPNAVSVLFGEGTGRFTQPALLLPVPAGQGTIASPHAVVVGDFNEDTFPDFATANRNGYDVVVRLGDGTGQFGDPLPTALLGQTGPTDLVTADVNGDGHVDIVTANNSYVSLLLGDGTGAFADPQFFEGVRLALALTVGDFNEDGAPDLAATGSAFLPRDRVFVFLNNGIGGFVPPTTLLLGENVGPTDVAAADLNKDGHLDVVAIGRSNLVSVLPGDGLGGFGEPLHSNTGIISSEPTLTLADVDGSGTVDLIVASGCCFSGVSILRNGPPDAGFRAPPGDFSTLVEHDDGTFTRTLTDGTQQHFDAQGLQTAVVDRNGNRTTYTYDAQERVTTITDPAGLVTTFTYAGTHLARMTDPAGRMTLFAHDAAGHLIQITDPDGRTRQFGYDARHRMTSQTSKRGLVTRYEYNFAGRNVKAIRPDGSTRLVAPAEVFGLIDPASGLGTETNPAPVVRPEEVVGTLTDGLGRTTTFQMDRFGAATMIVDPLGRETRVSRNADGDPVVTTSPNGAVTRQTYDAQGNVVIVTEAEGQPEARTTRYEYDLTFNQVTKMTDPAGKLTTIQRDAQGNPTTITNPLGGERVRKFDSRGLVLTDTDENGQTTTFTYDTMGNVVTRTNAEGYVTRFMRDTAGNVTTLIEGEGTPEQRTRTFTFDAMNRVTSATDGTGAVTQFRYDAQGNLLETELPTGQIERRTYDPLNRVASMDDPIRGRTQFTYDANGNLLQSINAVGDPTGFAYDAANQLITITDAVMGTQQFTYDVPGNVATFTDARNQTTTFAYDLFNRQTTRTNPLNQATQFTYDAHDNLLTTADPKHQLISRTYDALNRLTQITTPDNTMAITYDGVGNPLTVGDTDSLVTFTYDGLNRSLTESTMDLGAQPPVTLTSVYDAVGNRRQLRDSAPGTTFYEYDLAGRLSKLITPASQEILLAYDPAGRLDTIAFPNGVVSDYGYDSHGRLHTLTHTSGANPSFADLGYTYNPVGNIQSILDNLNTAQIRTYTYDALQRLTTGGTSTTPETYEYDLTGNRTTSFLSTAHTSDAGNRLVEDDDFTYTYDANGNLETKTRKADPTQVTTYQWDAQDQLIQIHFPDGTKASYKYDGLGRRIEKNVNGTITRYVYDGQDIVLEYDGANTFLSRYSHGQQTDQPLAVQRAGLGFFYYQADHQGSIVNLTDSSGLIANAYVYDSYGRRLSVFESVLQPYSYTGREFDAESRLYYYRARYYEPQTGRFLSEDPIGFAGGDANWYRYVRNNPVNYKDPFGFQGAATNPGAGVGDLPGAINDILKGQSDTRVTQDLFEALQDFRATLEPGQQADVDVLVDPVTKEILAIRPSEEPGIKNPGTKRFGPFPQEGFPRLPPPGLDPNNSPVCNTCPCQ